jgi:uncharacterized protein
LKHKRYLVFIIMLLLLLTLPPLSSAILAINPYTVYSRGFRRSLVVYAPAVTRSGEGALIEVNLTLIYPGSGRVYFSAQPLVELDTQATARIAAYVASRITGYDFYRYDYIVDMTSKSIVVGGPSAGGLMTIGFISLLLNKTPNKWVTMTGMINPDGSIGPVGGLLGKLEAVAEKGFKVFLIPYGQEETVIPRREVKRFLWGYYEVIRYERVNLVEKGAELGVNVIGVANIVEAMKYFLNITINTSTINPSLPVNMTNTIKELALRDEKVLSRIYNETGSEYNRMNVIDRFRFHGLVKNIKEEVGVIDSLNNRRLFIASLMESPEVLSDTLYGYWLIMYEQGKLDIESIEESINKTLNTTSNLFRTHNISLNPLSLEAYREYYTALNSYIDYLRKKNSLDLENRLSILAEIYSSLNYSQQLLNISGYSVEGLYGLTSRDLHLLYSIADSAVSYAYSLAKDIGSTNEYINDASNYFSRGLDALELNNTYAAIALFINSIVYADIGIEKLFISDDRILLNITSYLRESALAYISTPNDYSDIFYINAGDQYLSMGLIDESMLNYVKASMYASTLLKNVSVKGIIGINPVIPTISINRSPGSSGGNRIKPILVLPGDPMKSFILGVLVGITVFTIILLISKLFTRRKRFEEIPIT